MAILGGKKPAKPEENKDGRNPIPPLTMQAQRDIKNQNKQDAARSEELQRQLEAEKEQRDEEAQK